MKPQIFLSCILIIPIIGFVTSDKCPSSPPLTKIIDYELIKGHWLLAANKPEFDEKCKNLTFSIAENKKFILQEVLFMSKENWKRETNVYEVTKTPQAPFMLLENTASHYKVKLFLVDGDYSTYIIFYSCDDSSGTASDAWEIWTRGIRYESGTLPQPINRTLNKLKLKASDFSFTSASDCSH
ncbi:uncharacterized protein [Halyomorpha halys]|nr:uncharacterized protein LOC106689449 isoform X3 [Halyomorpha halys]